MVGISSSHTNSQNFKMLANFTSKNIVNLLSKLINIIIYHPEMNEGSIDVDLYNQQFDQKELLSIYQYFNNVLSNPEPAYSQQEIRSQPLNNQRQRVIKMDSIRSRGANFDQQLKTELQILLTHYCQTHGIKYKQGLNEIASPFVFFRKAGISLSKCEAIFHKFFVDFCLNFYDDEDFSSIELFIKMFSVVLKYHDPGLVRYLQWHSIQPQLFCINWLMTFFASKLSLKLVYLIWSFIATEKDKFLLFFLVLAIVEINRENIIETKNVNILQIVTNLIFKSEQMLGEVIERSLLLRKNTPTSLIVFFRNRMIFERKEKFNDVSILMQHIERFNLFLNLPEQFTSDYCNKNDCNFNCYICNLSSPIEQKQCFNQRLGKLVQISSDIRTMKLKREYVLLDLRIDQSKLLEYDGMICKIDVKDSIEKIEQKFLAQFIQEKGKVHFVILLTKFTFEDLSISNPTQLEVCNRMIKILNSLSFPLLSILEGGYEGLLHYLAKRTQKKIIEHKNQFKLELQSLQLPYSFPLQISDRFRFANAFCGQQVTTFVGIVQILIIFDYFIFIIPKEKELISFINYFKHSNTVVQYLYQHTHKPAQIMVHKVITMSSLKKASMKVHNQNILVLLYDSCLHQEKRIFSRISNYLEMDADTFFRLNQACGQCMKKKNKIVIQMDTNQIVKQCVGVLTKKYMQMRKRLKGNQQ